MRTWQEYMHYRVKGLEPDVPKYLEDKLKCYRFCHENGIATANVLRIFETPDQITLADVEDDFVIKPTLQSSMKGVRVLRKNSIGYYDSLRECTLTADEIVEEQRRLFEETERPSKKIIVEEKITDVEGYEVPRDFKAYAFRGKVALMLEIDRNTSPSSVSFFDGDFDPVADGRIVANPKYINRVDKAAPATAQEILQLAQKLSEKVPTPFARIDMYSTTEGPILGEITLTPGGFYYGVHCSLSDQQDKMMGKMWSDASNTLAELH